MFAPTKQPTLGVLKAAVRLATQYRSFGFGKDAPTKHFTLNGPLSLFYRLNIFGDRISNLVEGTKVSSIYALDQR